ncbi:hypothetical protein [Tessaracoccus caeni]|uniref:hypothetical protein n=1 Tax=Tessaracoccus caeni TaxID=3031239 RepID=UPI0023DC3F23|nr:hypothetical protein [Tessaracoccus caeni]MDF1489706.1 hypothetical protein [Tessaracoccus caeni]
MARKTRSASSARTMAEIVAEQQVKPKTVDPRLICPGTLNREGNLCDLDGNILSERYDDIAETDALKAVRAGALVAFEECGCGGGGGCGLEWFVGEQLSALAEPPQYKKGNEPSWISLWEGPAGNVVFVHGSYRWPGLF